MIILSVKYICSPLKKGTSPVVEWLRIHLPRKGTRVRFLVGELPIPHATGQLSHSATPREKFAHRDERSHMLQTKT